MYAVLEVGTRYGRPELSVCYMGTDCDTALNKFKEKFKMVAWDEKANRFYSSNGFIDCVEDAGENPEKMSTNFDAVFSLVVSDVVSGSKSANAVVDDNWADDFDEPFKYVLIKRTEG